MPTPAPIRREVRVATGALRAFRLFTESIGQWWPMAIHSVYEGTVAFEGSELVERNGAERSVWAEVIEWQVPTLIALAWHPGTDASTATDVRITFTEDAVGTTVTLVHSGWERSQHPEQAATDYGQGWPTVLGRYAALVTGVADTTGSVEDDV